MATLVDNPAYGEGHQVALKSADHLSAKARQLFTAAGYKPGAVFAIAKKTDKPFKTIELGTGSKFIYLQDPNKKVIKIEGSASSVNGLFNHYSENKTGGKSDTRLLTELKENISMELFRSHFEDKKMLSEDAMIEFIGNKKQYYDPVYYESAVKQLNALKSIVKRGGYTYERQATNKTVKLYRQATRLSKKQNDNWNPADVWMIKNGFRIDDIASLEDIDAINEAIARAYEERQLIPISLKQVTTPTASADIIDPAKIMEKKLDLDLSFEKVDLSDTFANFIVSTTSGFQARVGYKASATTLSVSIEGRMAGAGYQLGGVDAKWYPKHVATKYHYNVRGGAGVSEADYDTAKKELKEMFTKYGRLSNTIMSYEQAMTLFEKGDKLTKDRFANIISYMYSFLMAPGKKFEEHMQYVYYSAKKVALDNSMYVILHNG